jgi:putative transposase
MSNLRRYYSQGNLFFITTVTLDRNPILIKNFDLVKMAFDRTKDRFDIKIPAWVTLPDHLHMIIDTRTNNLSNIMKVLKQDFGFLYRKRNSIKTGRVWQLRFYDHFIRNQKDLNHHIDYIHFNPVKHGLVKTVKDYKYSSFGDFVIKGIYPIEWGDTRELSFDREYGE